MFTELVKFKDYLAEAAYYITKSGVEWDLPRMQDTVYNYWMYGVPAKTLPGLFRESL